MVAAQKPPNRCVKIEATVPRDVEPGYVNEVRAALYLRQSFDQTEGIERQRVRNKVLVTQRGWTVSADYEGDGTSASKDRGPKSRWARKLAGAKAKRVTHVIAVDLDRLLRSQRDP